MNVVTYFWLKLTKQKLIKRKCKWSIQHINFIYYTGLNKEGHVNEVYNVATHPTHTNLVASGGSDEKAYLWDLESMKIELECTG